MVNFNGWNAAISIGIRIFVWGTCGNISPHGYIGFKSCELLTHKFALITNIKLYGLEVTLCNDTTDNLLMLLHLYFSGTNFLIHGRLRNIKPLHTDTTKHALLFLWLILRSHQLYSTRLLHSYVIRHFWKEKTNAFLTCSWLITAWQS